MSIWRPRLGLVTTIPGGLLFAIACFEYQRYASYPGDPHTAERLQHVRLLNVLWCTSLYGSLLLGATSLFAKGRSRWTGLLVNFSAFTCASMILGAMCGPYNC